MDAGTTPDLFHQVLEKTFGELGVSGPVIHRLLLRDRHFAGHKFRCEGIQAILLIEGRVIEFCDEAGTLLMTVNVEPTEQRKAG